MQSWRLTEIETPEGTRSPVVLHSDDEGRAVVIGLDPGQELGDHQVKEFAYVHVIQGEVQIETGSERLAAPAGTLVRFEPDERRAISSPGGARMLLFLAPWPGEGHYRSR